MSDTILTFQVQLSAVMETVLKSAMYEITRLVEDSFLEEVARSKQEVEALQQRLRRAESRVKDREGSRWTRCVDCGRVGVSSKETKDRPSGRHSGAEAAPPLPLSKGCSELEWSPSVRQDTAPSSGSLLPEQRSNRQGGGESCGSYESKIGQEGLSVAGRQRSDPHLQRLSWTTFKLGDSDSEAEGPDPSYTAAPEPASPPTRREPQPRPAEEGAGLSTSPQQHRGVKSEGGVPLVKEEVELQPVCREEMDLETAHGESWDRGDLQVEHTAPSPPPQTPLNPLRSFTEKSLTLQFPPNQQRAAESSTVVHIRASAAELHLDAVDGSRRTSWDSDSLVVSKKTQNYQRGFKQDKPFSCVQCGQCFTQLKNLQAHLKHHAGETPHRCTQCGKSFLYQSRLKVHLLSHTGERPFSCSYCSKTFQSLYELKVHQRNHTGEKPYRCSQCGKGFTRLSVLKEHRIIHSREKSCCCTLCGKCFNRPSNLRAHMRRHVAAKPHCCSLCGMSFPELSRLQKHQKKFHQADAS